MTNNGKHPGHTPTLLSVFGVKPVRIGGTETFARELSLQLGERNWQSVLCFLQPPTEEVRQFLNLANITFKAYATPTNGTDPKPGGWDEIKRVATVIRQY